MKKVKTILYGAALLLLVNACDSILDREVVLSLTEDDVLTLYNNTQSRAVAIYNYLPFRFSVLMEHEGFSFR